MCALQREQERRRLLTSPYLSVPFHDEAAIEACEDDDGVDVAEIFRQGCGAEDEDAAAVIALLEGSAYGEDDDWEPWDETVVEFFEMKERPGSDDAT